MVGSSWREWSVFSVIALAATVLMASCGEQATSGAPRFATAPETTAEPSASRADNTLTSVVAAAEGSPAGRAGATAEATPPSDVPASPIPVDASDPTWGNPDALVTLVEFTDLQCPFCSRVEPTLAALREKYGPKSLRVVWKNNPLPFHERAPLAHGTAMTVHRLKGNGAFWGFVGHVFRNQADLRSDDAIYAWAASAGIRPNVLAAEEQRSAEKVRADVELARAVGATGTPGFRINGLVLSGAQPQERFEELIDAQLKRANELLEAGTDRRWVSTVLTRFNHREAPAAPPQPRMAAPDDTETTAWQIPVLPTDPTQGSDKALVTIVEFADFQCPFCERVNATLKQVLEDYPNDVRVVWKDQPLPFHPEARNAATFARHAFATQGNAGFWRAHSALFEQQRALGEPTYQKLATQLKLPWAPLQKALTNGKYDALIDESMELANDFQARGTPHFFINGRRLSGAQPYEKFKELIDEQLTKAKVLVQNGVPRAKVYATLMATATAAPDLETRSVSLPEGARPSRGPADAKIVIREFSDFQCPFCGRAQNTLQALLKSHPGDVRLEFRHLPLPFHKDAQLAAEASMEVFEQKGNAAFWRYHDLLFANQQALGYDDLVTYAKQVGVNLKQFEAALNDRRHQAAIDADASAANAGGVNGTPAFLINDYFVSGAQPPAAFEKVIKRVKSGKPGPKPAQPF